MSRTPNLLQVSDLTVTFSRWGQQVTALDRVNLEVPAGQWVMLVGHNGSGKSTLLNTISGRLKADAGDVRINGEPVSDLSASEIAGRLFPVHQNPLHGTARNMTVFDNLRAADPSEALTPQGSSPRLSLLARLWRFLWSSDHEHAQAYRALLAPLGLSDRLKQLALNLSGGERQILAMLIAQLRRCPLLLLDEPLAALDPGRAELCLDLIRQLHRSGHAILHVTHDPALATSGGDRTVVLQDGRIVYDKRGSERTLDDVRAVWGSPVAATTP